MSEFIRNGFRKKRLVRLNRCCLYIQVYTLADVCTGDGRKLISETIHGRNPMQGLSRIKWPNQGALPPSGWSLWRTALQKCFLVRRTQLSIREPLGKWLLLDPSHWPCWYNVADHSVNLGEGSQRRRFPQTRQGPLLLSSFTWSFLSAYVPPNTGYWMDFGWIPYLQRQGTTTGYDLHGPNLHRRRHRIL
jgi:hypothetical protein